MFLKNFKEKVSPIGKVCFSNCNLKSCVFSFFKIGLASTVFIAAIYIPLKGKIIENMLLSNPKAIIKAVEKIRETEAKRTQDDVKKKVPEVYNKLLGTNLPYIGAENASQTIQLFYDFRCGYCKKQIIELFELLKARNDIKVSLIDFPVLSRESFVASQVNLYVFLKHRNSFNTFFRNIVVAREINEESLKAALKAAKLPVSVFVEAQKDSSIIDTIKNNHELGSALQLQGTPASIVGKNGKEPSLIPGYATPDVILSNLNK